MEPRASAAPQFRVSALASFATYRNAVYAGEYQGYTGAVGYTHPWFALEASMAGYRIVRNGARDWGPGDLLLMARGTAYRFDSEAAVGVALASTLPTGDEEVGLGMGHTMLMPGAWFALQHGAFSLALDLAYGRALGGGSSHHHSSTGPLVNPMNRSEIEHALTLSYAFWRGLFAAVRLYGAVPIADADGQTREALGFVLGGQISRFELAAEQHLPLAGDPFQAKTILRASATF